MEQYFRMVTSNGIVITDPDQEVFLVCKRTYNLSQEKTTARDGKRSYGWAFVWPTIKMAKIFAIKSRLNHHRNQVWKYERLLKETEELYSTPAIQSETEVSEG